MDQNQMDSIYNEKRKSQNSILSSIYDDLLHAHTSDMQMVDEKITANCEKFLQDYKQRFLQTEALCKSLQQREFELKRKEQKLLKDKRKLKLKKRVRQRLSSCKQLVNECYSSRKVAEGLKREIDMLHTRRAELEDKLKAESFESLQSEIMQLEIALKDIEDNDRIDLQEKLKNLQRELIDKGEQLEELKNCSYAFSLTIDQNNDELKEARQELIDGLKSYPCSGYIYAKTMGMLDSKPFFVDHVSTETANKNATNFRLVCRHLEDPDWFPFTIITDGSDKKEIINEEDEKIIRLKAECSEEQYRAVTTALNERNQYVTYVTLTEELWNYKEQRKASLREGINYILNKIEDP